MQHTEPDVDAILGYLAAAEYRYLEHGPVQDSVTQRHARNSRRLVLGSLLDRLDRILSLSKLERDRVLCLLAGNLGISNEDRVEAQLYRAIDLHLAASPAHHPPPLSTPFYRAGSRLPRCVIYILGTT